MKKTAVVLGALLAVILITPSVIAQGRSSDNTTVVSISKNSHGVALIDTSLAAGTMEIVTDPDGLPTAYVATDIRITTKSGTMVHPGGASPAHTVVFDAPGREQVVGSSTAGTVTTYLISSSKGMADLPSTTPTVVNLPAGVEGLAKVDDTVDASSVKYYTDAQGRENIHAGRLVRIETADGQVINEGASTPPAWIVVDADGAEVLSQAWKNDTMVATSIKGAGDAAKIDPISTTTTTAPPSTTTTTAPSTTTTTAPPSDGGSSGGSDSGSTNQDPSGTVAFPPKHDTVLGDKTTGRFGFISTCPYVHTDTVDPIVFPGDTTKSHAHDFFGNRSTNAHTTTDSLIAAGRTSCEHADDLSSYWVPSVYENGKQVAAVGTSMYYFTDKVADPKAMKSIPVGLRMIAGNAKATSPQSWKVAWIEEHRNSSNNTWRNGDKMITANQTGQVIVRVNFPQCWNGTQLDSPDHKSHMAYINNDGTCPGTHPVLLPQLTMFVRYDTPGGSAFSLSSGPWYTAHADFWNAWHPETLQALLDRCRTSNDCQRVKSR